MLTALWALNWLSVVVLYALGWNSNSWIMLGFPVLAKFFQFRTFQKVGTPWKLWHSQVQGNFLLIITEAIYPFEDMVKAEIEMSLLAKVLPKILFLFSIILLLRAYWSWDVEVGSRRSRWWWFKIYLIVQVTWTRNLSVAQCSIIVGI